MSSERLYYSDSYLIEFDAVVRDVQTQGERWKITLDRTAFYPTSGGQPFDTGTLDTAQVVDVCDAEDGTIAHIVDRALEKNSRVRGHVDWTRRFDHMQQHTGQHLLSAAFDREVGAKTVSFHLGTTSSTIDLDKELTPNQVLRVEDTVNKVLWEDREVCVKFVTASEAAKLPLRKDPARSGDLRIIEIQDYDLSACGGTHVRRTGAIGIIAVAGFERFKGGLRVEFLCGSRALRAYRALKGSIAGGVRLLSVLPDELPAAIEKLQAAGRNQQKAQEALQERLALHEAGVLSASGEQIGSANLVATTVSGWDAKGLKRLASAVVSKPGTIAVLVTSETPSLIVVGRSQDLAIDTGAVLTPLLERFGGKGGGKGAMAQGGGLTGDAQEILRIAKEQIGSMVAGE
ncbi:MAG TPA: DHHA1 domain-containing protein [Vicinamibacterales bacterium]|nr:DHHA1 domain-containing protein [Vicinamibacterales bacterium]